MFGFKRFWSLVFIAVLIISTVVNLSSAAVPVEDIIDYESFDGFTGSASAPVAPTGWMLGGSTSTADKTYPVGEAVAPRTDKSLKLYTTDDNGKNLQVRKEWEAITSNTNVELQARVDSRDLRREVQAYVNISGSSYTYFIRFENDGKFKFADQKTGTVEYAENTWYTINCLIEFEPVNSKVIFNVTVRETKNPDIIVVQNASSVTSTDLCFKGIRFYQAGVSAKTGSFYIDDLYIYRQPVLTAVLDGGVIDRPANGTNGDNIFKLSFNYDMDGPTLNNSNITVTGANVPSYTVSIDPTDAKKCIIAFSKALRTDSTYTININGQVKSLDGKEVSNKTITFNTAPSIRVTPVTYYEKDGKPITELEAGAITAKVSVQNFLPEPQNISLLLAVKKDNVIYDIDIMEAAVYNSVSQLFTATVNVPSDLIIDADSYNNYRLETFIWDGASTMVPVKDKEVINPDFFDWDTGVNIIRNGDGTYSTDFDVSQMRPAELTTYYVDPVNGLDTNSGTEEKPFKTIDYAIKRSAAGTIMLLEGHYDISTGLLSKGITKDISIIAKQGAKVQLSTAVSGSWVKTDGQTNVYEKASDALVYNVWDAAEPDSEGDYIKYEKSDSIVSVEGNPSSWYYDSAAKKVYVHATGSNSANLMDIRAYTDVFNVNMNSTAVTTVYLEGIDFEGGTSGAIRIGDNNILYAKNCSFKYANGSGGIQAIASLSYMQNCTAAWNVRDGFNYHYRAETGIVPKAVEINCIGRNNGEEGKSDNGSTAHDGAYIFRLNGEYYSNKGPNIADTGGSKSWNVGSKAYNSVMYEITYNCDFTTSDDGSKMWLEGCSNLGSNSTYSLNIGNNLSAAYIRDCTFSESGIIRTTGRITSY